MKKTAIIFVLVSLLAACKKDLTSLNVDPKHPASVPSYSLFTESERLLSNAVTSSNVNLNIFRLIEQQWTETTYLNETNYQLPSRNQPDQIWSSLYTVIFNLEKAKQAMATDVSDAGTRKNETAIADILQVYTYYYLLTTFGDIPYSQALNIKNPFPAYDDAKTVYTALLTRLDADIAELDPTAGSFGSADIIGGAQTSAYAGNPAEWKLFANSFKLKMGITMVNYDNAAAQKTVESAVASGVFTSNADNALLVYQSAPPNTNPVWVDLVQSQRHDFVGTSEFIGLLNPNSATQDPRLPYFFSPNIAGGTYVGAANGSGNGGLVYSQYSLPSGPLLTAGSVGSLTNPNFPGDLLDYSETEFNLAEAAARGYNVGGTIESHYNAAITASITYWGGTDAQAAAYLALPNVVFATAGNPEAPGVLTPLQKIALQEYIALYNRGWDAWILTRRLAYPVLTPPVNAYSGFPMRFTYPLSEQNVNKENYDKAAAAIGGDKVTTKLFFE